MKNSVGSGAKSYIISGEASEEKRTPGKLTNKDILKGLET
jgi:hypothetical protein